MPAPSVAVQVIVVVPTAKVFPDGERVTVTGNPTHTGSDRIAFKRLVRPDGSELLPAGPQRANALEEERRQRALQRKAGVP